MSDVRKNTIIRGVADTYALIWYVNADPRLSNGAYRFIDAVAEAGEFIAVSSITLVEVAYLSEKARIPQGTLDGILAEFDRSDACFIEIPVDRRIAQALHSVPREAVPDMPDRIITATAVTLGVPVIRRDRKIRLSTIRTIW